MLTKTYATLSLNVHTLTIPDVLVEERLDGHKAADGSYPNVDQFTAYAYAATATSANQPKLQRVTRSDGSWSITSMIQATASRQFTRLGSTRPTGSTGNYRYCPKLGSE